MATASSLSDDRTDLKAHVEHVAALKIDFIDSAEFPKLKLRRKDKRTLERLLAWRDQRTGDDATEIAGHACPTAPLLRPDEEQLLFQQMNYARYIARREQDKLNPRRPAKRRIETVESNLALAEAIRARLVESNTRLVISIARRLSSSPQQFEEFVSDGLMILLGAIDKFDYSRGFRFSTYATHSVQRHFYRCWKTAQRHQQRFVVSPPEVFTDVQQEVEETSAADQTAVFAQVMRRARKCLDDREHRILCMRYGVGDATAASTLREIGAELGISKERVRQLQMQALETLRNLMPDVEIASQPG